MRWNSLPKQPVPSFSFATSPVGKVRKVLSNPESVSGRADLCCRPPTLLISDNTLSGSKATRCAPRSVARRLQLPSNAQPPFLEKNTSTGPSLRFLARTALPTNNPVWWAYRRCESPTSLGPSTTRRPAEAPIPNESILICGRTARSHLRCQSPRRFQQYRGPVKLQEPLLAAGKRPHVDDLLRLDAHSFERWPVRDRRHDQRAFVLKPDESPVE